MVDTSLVARISTPGSDNPDPRGETIPLKLIYGGALRDFNSVAFQLYPNVSARVESTSGSIIAGPGREVGGFTDVLLLNGGDEGVTGFPVESLSSYRALGNVLDKEGNTISVGLSVDRERHIIKASKPCYGTFMVTYRTSFRQYWYIFPEPNGRHTGQLAAFFEGTVQFLGRIIAIYRGSVATLEVTRPEWQATIPEGEDYGEVYRITSQYVVDETGAWEYPPGWPDDTSYPQGSDEEPDNGSYQVLERVHEIGYTRPTGSAAVRRFDVMWEKPFSPRDGSYRPVYRAQGGIPADLVDDIRARYPGLL